MVQLYPYDHTEPVMKHHIDNLLKFLLLGRCGSAARRVGYISASPSRRLLANGRGGHHQADTDTQQHHNQACPRDEAGSAELVGVAALGPRIRSVDGGVAIDVGAVLVGELVHPVSLQNNESLSRLVLNLKPEMLKIDLACLVHPPCPCGQRRRSSPSSPCSPTCP